MSPYTDSTTEAAFRWIAVLPAAVAAGILGYLSHRASILMTGGRMIPVLDEIMAMGLAGFGFVIAGTFVAPAGRKVVSVFLLILFIAINGLVAFVGIKQGNSNIVAYIGLVAGLFGAGIGSVYGFHMPEAKGAHGDYENEPANPMTDDFHN